MKKLKFTLILFMFFLLSPLVANGQKYITWKGLEPDKLASIWLIKRFVDKNAEFILVPKGSFIKDGILFDVPSAALKRTHSRSTFETVLESHPLDNDRLVLLAKIIHDIEINTWDEKKMEETPIVQDALWKIIDQKKDDNKVIHLACLYFDELYETL